MKQLFVLVLTLSVGLQQFASGQQHTPQQVLAVDSLWNRYRLESNTQKLEELLVDNWILTHSDGRVQDKKAYLDELRNRTRNNQEIKNEGIHVRLYGNTAVVTGKSIQSGLSDGKPWSGTFRFTRVWVYLNFRWVMLASHSSTLVTP